MIKNFKHNQRGVILPITIMLILIIMWLASTVSVLTINSLSAARNLTQTARARMALDAALELAVQEINTDPDNYSDIAETTFYTDPDGRFRVTYEADIENSSGLLADIEKNVVGTGRVYSPASSSTPTSTRKAKVYVLVSDLPFSHSVQTGSGPFFLYGNAGIDATGQSIYSNNFIYMQNNASETFGNIYVAGYRTDGLGYDGCPFSRSGRITGSNVYISSDAGVQPPTSCGVAATGVTTNYSDPPIQPLPNVPAGEMEEITVDHGSCTLPGSGINIAFPSKHYPNNSYPGTASGCNMTLPQNKNYTISGNIHIRGNFDGTRATLTTGTSLGSNPVYFIVEGTITLDRTVVAGTAPIIFVSYSKCDAQYVGCDSVAGVLETDLSTVKNNASAIDIKGNNLNMNAYFLARDGSITFTGSVVSGGLGALAAQSVIINGSGTNSFANTYPDIGGGGTWAVRKYQRIFD